MYRIILFLSFLTLSNPSWAAIAFVNATSGQAGGGTAATGTLSTTAGNMLVCIVTGNANGSGCGANTVSISDNASTPDTFTAISAQVSQSFNCSRDYYAKNITGGSVTISATWSANQAKAFSCSQFSGLDTSTPLDSSASKSGNCNTGTCTSASFSTAVANEVILLLDGNYYSSNGFTAGNIGGVASAIGASMTSPSGTDGNMRTTGEYLVVSATQSAITAAMSIAGASQQSDYFVAAFEQAAATSTAVGGLIVQGGLTATGGLTVNAN